MSGNHCCFPNCDGRKLRRPTFRLPPADPRRKLWITVIKLAKSDPNWIPAKTSRVCSGHFNPAEVLTGLGRKTSRLLPDAIPLLASSDLAACEAPSEDQSVIAAPVGGTPENAQHDISTELFPQLATSHIPSTPIATTPRPKRERVIAATPKRTRKRARRELFPPLLTDAFESPPPALTPKRARYEHSYVIKASPATYSKKLVKLLQRSKSKLKNIQRSQLRLKKRILKLEDVISEYKKAGGDENSCEFLQTNYRYNGEVKQFAVTLHFYSPKAYRFLRKFITLPHEKTLTAWMSSVNCNPGFSNEVIQHLTSVRKKCSTGFNVMNDVVLDFDEMAIRKDTPWDPSQNKFVGHVDYGQGELEGESPLATNVLVCLAAGISGGWKCPIGYILTDHADSDTMKNFVVAAVRKLSTEGFQVHGIVIDGATGNTGMCKRLGLDEGGVVEGRTDTRVQIDGVWVHAIYDVCHMLKLWRNLLFQNDIIWDGNVVSFVYVRRLFEMQDHELIRAGNPLSLQHMKWDRHKMKVRLAVQVLSDSVADAIDFCRIDLKLPAFKGSEFTSKFIRLLNEVFDILNSRSIRGKGSKSPITLENFVKMESKLLAAVETFKNLKINVTLTRRTKSTVVKTTTLVSLVKTVKKRAAVGLIVAIKSIISISKLLLNRTHSPFLYICTYRFSQDLLELLFGIIRSKLGANNNPNVLEFKAILKKLWHHNLLVPVTNGNCSAKGDTGVQGFLPLQRKKKVQVNEYDTILEEYNYFNIDPVNNTKFYNNCLAYIAGAAISTILEDLVCPDCAFSLIDSSSDPLSDDLKMLIKRKDRGGLHCPSNSVYQLVKLTDTIFRSKIRESRIVPTAAYFDLKILKLVQEAAISLELFPELDVHVHQMEFSKANTTSHFVHLLRKVVNQFLKIRLHDYGRRFNRNMGVSERHNRNKLTLFRNE